MKKNRGHNSRVMDVLIRSNRTKATFQNDILREQATFFQTLYCTRKEKLLPTMNYLESTKILKLPLDERLVLGEPLVYEEIVEAI